MVTIAQFDAFAQHQCTSLFCDNSFQLSNAFSVRLLDETLTIQVNQIVNAVTRTISWVIMFQVFGSEVLGYDNRGQNKMLFDESKECEKLK